MNFDFNKTDRSKSFFAGIKGGIPIGLGYLSVSFAFGIAAVSKGLPAYLAVIISMTNVTSAGQLAGLDLMVAGASLWEMALTQLVINIRYALMSVSLSQKVDKSVSLADKLLISFCNTDEVFAVASSQKGRVNRWFLYGLIIPPYLGWAFGTLLGSMASGLLPEGVLSALGIAIYGMFVAIIIPPARNSRAVGAVIGCAVLLSSAFFFLPLLSSVSSGFAIIICAVAASALGAWLAPVKDEEAVQ